MKQYLLILFSLFALTAVRVQANPHEELSWSFDARQYQYDMTVYYYPYDTNGETIDGKDCRIAAFVGEECRGIGTLTSSMGIEYGYLRVRSNVVGGETVCFRYYDSESDTEGKVSGTEVLFEADAVYGQPSSPLQMTIPLNWWSCDEHQFEYDMTIYYQLVLNGQPTSLKYYQIAAYVGNDCRGIGQAKTVTAADGANVSYGYMRIRSSVPSGEEISFRFYDNGTNEEGVSIGSNLVFQADTVIGLPSSPLVISVDVAPVVVTAVSYTREYGEANPVFDYSVEGPGIYGEPEIVCDATASSPVGDYPIIISKGSVNNTNDSYVNGTLTITPAPLTVSVGEYVRKQAEENPVFTISYSGFKNEETEAVLAAKPMAQTQATVDSEPGRYPIVLSGAEAQNYLVRYEEGSLTIERTSFAIRYYLDGSLIRTDSALYGARIPLSESPVKEGYTFSGWSDLPTTMPAGDLTVYGTFSPKRYALTWMLDGEPYATDSAVYASPLSTYLVKHADMSREGCTFSGWQLLSDSLMPSHDITIEGRFSVNSYTLTWMVDGEIYRQYDVAYGTALVAEQAPAKLGCTFSGWSDLPATMPARDVVVSGSFSYDEQCPAPTVSYEDGTLKFACELPDVLFVSEVSSPDMGTYQSDSISLAKTYLIQVYAQRDGYADSEVTTAMLLWIDAKSFDTPLDDKLEIEAVPVLVYGTRQEISVRCLLENEQIEVYTADGRQIARAQIVDGAAVIRPATDIDGVVVVKVAGQTFKLLIK